ncbi:hypothetical protein BH11ACT8_BH11ACT8_34190 [soil metagenome]
MNADGGPHRWSPLLLDAGADPNDAQTMYDRLFTPDDTHLHVLLGRGLGEPLPSRWRARLGERAYQSPDELLGDDLVAAGESGFLERIRLLLAHGVDPSVTGKHPVLRGATAYEAAVRAGQLAAADLLAAAGSRLS